MSEYMRRLRERVGNELLEVPAAGLVAFDDEGRVLLVRHADGEGWTTPGGAIEPRESPADAAVREMWEETGLHVELLRIIGVYGGPDFEVTYANGDLTSYLMVIFECRVISGEIRPDGDEILEAAWLSRLELAELDTPPWMATVLADAYAGADRARFRAAAWQPADRS